MTQAGGGGTEEVLNLHAAFIPDMKPIQRAMGTTQGCPVNVRLSWFHLAGDAETIRTNTQLIKTTIFINSNVEYETAWNT